ncbi:MAG: helix-turn-helix domain-containing protein [Clostridia bacterium]|nr:helix-turn-helix domain-containing protein [Clostridia bacterium]
MLSEKLYELRKRCDLSQKELAALLGVTNKAVSKWETGAAVPKTETLLKMADIFGVSRQELLEDSLPSPTEPPTLPAPPTLAELQAETVRLAPDSPTASTRVFTRRSAIVYLMVGTVLFILLWLIWGSLMSKLLPAATAWPAMLIPAAVFVGLFTGFFYLVRLWRRIPTVLLIVGALLFGTTVLALWVGGVVMTIPSVIWSIKTLSTKKETGHGTN